MPTALSNATQVFPLRHLECFYEDEIERLLCGEGETWCVLMPAADPLSDPFSRTANASTTARTCRLPSVRAATW
jgi:hypothetical protein